MSRFNSLVFRCADNFKNLCELPILFYAVVALSIIAGAVTPLTVQLAWLFVAGRAVHSAIHCTYNAVPHRFAVYFGSALVLWAMWALLAAHVFAQ